jgi:hypothetical protein
MVQWPQLGQEQVSAARRRPNRARIHLGDAACSLQLLEAPGCQPGTHCQEIVKPLVYKTKHQAIICHEVRSNQQEGVCQSCCRVQYTDDVQPTANPTMLHHQR